MRSCIYITCWNVGFLPLKSQQRTKSLSIRYLPVQLDVLLLLQLIAVAAACFLRSRLSDAACNAKQPLPAPFRQYSSTLRHLQGKPRKHQHLSCRPMLKV
jgi:hypothetical protein